MKRNDLLLEFDSIQERFQNPIVKKSPENKFIETSEPMNKYLNIAGSFVLMKSISTMRSNFAFRTTETG